ncbi:MAG TPA: hypothetical protein VK324_14490, partial [Tepidisphaeraceae bacterium]|nr:hypothetical protein [Tepidisphaeraceae bacterium]
GLAARRRLRGAFIREDLLRRPVTGTARHRGCRGEMRLALHRPREQRRATQVSPLRWAVRARPGGRPTVADECSGVQPS